MHFDDWMELVVKAFEVAGVIILAVGSLAALVGAVKALSRGARRTAYKQARQDVGRAILLGLEVLIIADIVQTITIDPTLESTLTLALIVLVRTCWEGNYNGVTVSYGSRASPAERTDS